ncbi:MAG: phosphate ABC transporter permease subunit PstC [Gemmatimonadota bacterium]|nr:phosphate ABC transporter permease subunit PstC [Gemmatimonadota bacterium]MDH5758727.1 phosphate ABC transporter permease subunit PstC [Gemmatimonadota bacterium]
MGFRARRNLQEKAIGFFLFACAALSTLVTVGIVFVLLSETLSFFREVSIVEFLTHTRWEPMFQEKHFGILPLAAGSIQIAAGAAVIALPAGLLTAVFLSEYAPRPLRAWLKPILEILAGIPTVVYGYFALTFVTPLLRVFFPETDIFNAASASIVVGIMIIPTVSSLSEDALRAVPEALREGAYGLGATKLEVSTRVVVPAALSGIVASFILAISRAIGETMAVTIAAGARPNLTWNPLESIQTMTAYIVQASLGDTPHGTVVYKTLFAVGMTLFVITLVMNVLSQWVLARFREEYE